MKTKQNGSAIYFDRIDVKPKTKKSKVSKHGFTLYYNDDYIHCDLLESEIPDDEIFVKFIYDLLLESWDDADPHVFIEVAARGKHIEKVYVDHKQYTPEWLAKAIKGKN